MDEVKVEEVVETTVETTDSPEVETSQAPVEEVTDTSEVEAKNKQLFERAKKAEAEAKAARARLETLEKAQTKSLDVEDYIGISAALDGLDGREKEYLAKQHKLSGQPLSEIRQSEDFSLWQSAYRTKVEKENSLKPTGTQETVDKPVSFVEMLRTAGSTSEKEDLLKKAGLIKESTVLKQKVILKP